MSRTIFRRRFVTRRFPDKAHNPFWTKPFSLLCSHFSRRMVEPRSLGGVSLPSVPTWLGVEQREGGSWFLARRLMVCAGTKVAFRLRPDRRAAQGLGRSARLSRDGRGGGADQPPPLLRRSLRLLSSLISLSNFCRAEEAEGNRPEQRPHPDSHLSPELFLQEGEKFSYSNKLDSSLRSLRRWKIHQCYQGKVPAEGQAEVRGSPSATSASRDRRWPETRGPAAEQGWRSGVFALLRYDVEASASTSRASPGADATQTERDESLTRGSRRAAVCRPSLTTKTFRLRVAAGERCSGTAAVKTNLRRRPFQSPDPPVSTRAQPHCPRPERKRTDPNQRRPRGLCNRGRPEGCGAIAAPLPGALDRR